MQQMKVDLLHCQVGYVEQIKFSAILIMLETGGLLPQKMKIMHIIVF
jgi:hypothetical protein